MVWCGVDIRYNTCGEVWDVHQIKHHEVVCATLFLLVCVKVGLLFTGAVRDLPI